MIVSVMALLALQATSPDTVVLEPVTITATRQPISLFAVPLAVTQLKKKDWFGTTGYGLDQALNLVPGVVAQSRYGNQDVRVTIRGYGARGAGDRSNAGTTRGIRILLDGFPETEPDGRTSLDGVDLAAAHDLEVVRSNASAVWGNAAGGVVNISTLPGIRDPRASVEPMAGSFGLQRYAVRGSMLMGASGILGASFVHSDADGWRAHSASTRSVLNVSALAPVGDETQLGVYVVGSHNLFRIPGPLTEAQVAADPRQANATYQSRDERRDNRVARLGLTLEHRASQKVGISAMLYANPKALQRSERGTFRDFTRYHIGGNGVVRVATPFGAGVDGALLVGADYALQDGAILFYNLSPQRTRGDTLRDNKAEGARNAGMFVAEDLTFGANERWNVSVGARYDDITYDYRSYINPSLNDKKSFTGVTPKLGVSYRFASQHSVYASMGGGIEVPAGNETDPASTFGQDTIYAINPLLEPIRSLTVEIGTKRLWAMGTGSFIRELSYDVALYQTNVKNEIIPYRGGRFYFTAGSARRRGAELGVRVATSAGLSLQAALTWNAHRYTEYLVDSVYYDTTKPGVFADYSGNNVVGVPAFTGSFALDVAPASLKPVRLRVGVETIGSFYADDANQVTVPSYRVANASLGTDQPIALGARLGLNAFVTVNNLFDTRYIASAFLNPDVVGGEPVAFEPGFPRNFVVGVSLTAR
ncbi:MAG TPA: TonB-dependent receptor [Gemmatimonadales bacterium]|nr:TonB-dependent receptor [Gemmatimonadales bacterium]